MDLIARDCPRCGANVRSDVGAVVATCRYCGAALTVPHDDPVVKGGLTSATRSEDTRAAVSVTFENAGARALDLVWLDFGGAEKGYGRVEPGEMRSFNTYVGHVWSVRVAESGGEVLRWAARDQVPKHVRVPGAGQGG